MKNNDAGKAGFTRIAQGLADLFEFLAELDRTAAPRRGRREKDGMVVEYSFGKRTLGEDAGERDESPQARRTEAPAASRRQRPGVPEVAEPVTDLFDEPDEVVVLFELPGVTRNQVDCRLDGDILLLEAGSGERRYRKEILIEAALANATPRLRLRNGILEVRLAKQRRG